MKNKIIFILAIIVILLTIYYIKRNQNIPNTVTIQIITDSTSSGGDRKTTAYLKYKDALLLTGTATYLAHPGFDGEINYTCAYNNGKWSTIQNKSTGITDENKSLIENCNHIQPYPTTTEGLRREIKSKNFLPAGSICGHQASCYKIIK